MPYDHARRKGGVHPKRKQRRSEAGRARLQALYVLPIDLKAEACLLFLAPVVERKRPPHVKTGTQCFGPDSFEATDAAHWVAASYRKGAISLHPWRGSEGWRP